MKKKIKKMKTNPNTAQYRLEITFNREGLIRRGREGGDSFLLILIRYNIQLDINSIQPIILCLLILRHVGKTYSISEHEKNTAYIRVNFLLIRGNFTFYTLRFS